MKNVLLACFSFIVILGVLAGCSNDTAAPKEDAAEKQTKKKSETEKQNSEDTAADEGEKAAADEEPAADEKAETPADVSNAVDFTEAQDPNKPLPFGTYMKANIYSTEDRKYHPVYVKLNKITSESEDAAHVQKALDENNAEGYDFDAVTKEALNLPDDLEINVIDYEVAVPKEFPVSEHGGVTGINISFSARSIEGGGVPTGDGGASYIGLGVAEKLLSPGDREKTFMPGNTYQLRAYFVMVKGFKDYLIEAKTYPEGSDGTEFEDMKTVYFAIK